MSYSKSELRNQRWRFTSVDSVGTTTFGEGAIQSNLTKSGSNVPKFRSIIKSGGNAFSVYSRTGDLNVKELYPFGFFVRTKNAENPPKIYPESVAGTWFSALPSSPRTDITDASTQALTKLYKRLSEQQTHFHGMQFLGELRETVALFKHPFRTARTLVDKYMEDVRKNALRYQPRRSLPGRRKFEKAIADSWLEVAFGIKPLLSDVKDAAKAAIQLAYDNNYKRDRIVATAEVLYDGANSSVNASTGTSFVRLNQVTVSQTVHRARWVAYLDWTRSAATGSMERVLEVTGFRPDLFVPTLYELAPWSFLVDYFSNLGTVIETGCQSQSVVKFALLSYHLERVDRSVTNALGSIVLTSDIFGSPGRQTVIRKSFFRPNATSQIPSVPFSVSIPGKPTQYVNMLALWRGKAKSF
jgi:hypothetical protein